MLSNNKYTHTFKFRHIMSNKFEHIIHETLNLKNNKFDDLNPSKLSFNLFMANMFNKTINNSDLFQETMYHDIHHDSVYFKELDTLYSFYNEHTIPHRTYVYPYIKPVYDLCHNPRYLAMEPVPYIHPITVKLLNNSLEHII